MGQDQTLAKFAPIPGKEFCCFFYFTQLQDKNQFKFREDFFVFGL